MAVKETSRTYWGESSTVVSPEVYMERFGMQNEFDLGFALNIEIELRMQTSKHGPPQQRDSESPLGNPFFV